MSKRASSAIARVILLVAAVLWLRAAFDLDASQTGAVGLALLLALPYAEDA